MGHHQKEQMLHFEQRTYQSRIQVWFCWKAIWSKPSQNFYKTSLFNHEGANHTYVYLRMYNMVYNPTWLRNEPYHLIGVWGIDPCWPLDPMEGCSHLLGALQSHLQLQNRLIFATPEQCNFIHVCQEDHLRAKPLLNSLAATTSLANKNGYYAIDIEAITLKNVHENITQIQLDVFSRRRRHMQRLGSALWRICRHRDMIHLGSPRLYPAF